MRPFFLFGLLFVFYFNVNAQNRSIDSLTQLLKNSKNSSDKVILQCKISQAYTEIGDFKKGAELADLALNEAKNLKDKKGEGFAYFTFARLNQYMRDWDNALIYHYQAIQLLDEANATEELAWSYLNMGISFDAKKEFDRAIRYETKALESFLKIKHKQGEAYSNLNLGLTHFGNGNLDTAFAKLEKAKILCESIGDKRGVGYVYNIRGNIYFQTGKLEDALIENSKCLQIRIIENDKRDLSILYGRIANINFLQKKYKDALKALQEAEKSGLEVNASFALKEVYLTWSKVDSANGNFKDAYSHLKEHNKHSQIISEEDIKMQVTALQYACANEQKTEKEKYQSLIDECENQSKENNVGQTGFQKYYGILLLFSLIGLIILSFLLYRSRKN